MKSFMFKVYSGILVILGILAFYLFNRNKPEAPNLPDDSDLQNNQDKINNEIKDLENKIKDNENKLEEVKITDDWFKRW